MRIFASVCYDGTLYQGWQKQPDDCRPTAGDAGKGYEDRLPHSESRRFNRHEHKRGWFWTANFQGSPWENFRGTGLCAGLSHRQSEQRNTGKGKNLLWDGVCGFGQTGRKTNHVHAAALWRVQLEWTYWIYFQKQIAYKINDGFFKKSW